MNRQLKKLPFIFFAQLYDYKDIQIFKYRYIWYYLIIMRIYCCKKKLGNIIELFDLIQLLY